ncbi:FAD-dependent monooxygenase [Gordonia sp. SL306]|uniref:FAD-dependent monooxygenase n=1 Tax=Gordonia sp. SL306 TaxID=2995145 RepID=UPI0022707AD9|nr:FAD-dependent monooxygenase [Gordonia sp. SL306]WAC58290.1 FAD-dependent monooxygenase [Gordonia sp. SL306]
MTIGSTRYRWEFQLLDGEEESDLADLDALAPLLRPWLGVVGIDQLHLARSAHYIFRARRRKMTDRRVSLLVDSAHLRPPVSGQSAGAGIRDAANLSWKLESVLRALCARSTATTVTS